MASQDFTEPVPTESQSAARKASPPPAERGLRIEGDSVMGWLISTPALIGLTLFLLIPFAMAVILSFTDQRMLSPDPTEYVGLRNYRRLLSLTVLTLDPITEDGEVVLDDEGSPTYPRSRDILRTDEYTWEDGTRYQEWFYFHLFGRRIIVAAADAQFWIALTNNLSFTIVVVPLQSTLALLLAILINQKIPGSNVFRTIFFSPVVTSMVVVSVLWTLLYDEQGLINQFLQAIPFLDLGPYDWLESPQSAMLSIIIMSIWQGVGFQMVIFLAGLQGIPEELYEAAAIDGANEWQKFLNVTIPGLRNTIVFVAISTTILAFRLFTQVDVMTDGGPGDATRTVMYHIVQTGKTRQNIGPASAMSVVFFLIILVIALIQRRVLRSNEVV